MTWNEFNDPKKHFSVVLFVQDEDLKERRGDIEALGARKNVKLVVQPCPYEGIEFLYRVAVELPGHKLSADRDLFWQAVELSPAVPAADLDEISKHHYEYLLAILEQDAPRVMRARKALEPLIRKYQ